MEDRLCVLTRGLAGALIASLAVVMGSGCAAETCGTDAGGETSGELPTDLAKSDTYNEVRLGVHAMVWFDEATETFQGTVHNVTESRLDGVRVEVHLSSGVELGPTPEVALEPNEEKSVELDAAGQAFDMWTAHAEVGAHEHGCDGHGDGDHD